MVWINSENLRHLATPFGGVKASGIGRDGGDWSFKLYTKTKNITLALGPRPTQQLGRDTSADPRPHPVPPFQHRAPVPHRAAHDRSCLEPASTTPTCWACR